MMYNSLYNINLTREKLHDIHSKRAITFSRLLLRKEVLAQCYKKEAVSTTQKRKWKKFQSLRKSLAGKINSGDVQRFLCVLGYFNYWLDFFVRYQDGVNETDEMNFKEKNWMIKNMNDEELKENNNLSFEWEN